MSLSKYDRKTVRDDLGSKRYRDWLGEVIIDFGDYDFTRNELNDIGVGMHFRAASYIQRHIKSRNLNLTAIYNMKMASFYRHDTRGIGEVSLIVIAHCIAAARPDWDVLKWIGERGRTVRGAVRKAKKDR